MANNPLTALQAVDLIIEKHRQDRSSGFPELFRLYDQMERGEWMFLLGRAWDLVWYHGKYTDRLNEILLENRQYWHELMTDDENYLWQNLPDEIVLYRGCSEINRHSLCWTSSKSMAQSYLTSRKTAPNGNPLILTAKIYREDIAAAKITKFHGNGLLRFSDHHEFIIVNPSKLQIQESTISLAECQGARYNEHIWGILDGLIGKA